MNMLKANYLLALGLGLSLLGNAAHAQFDFNDRRHDPRFDRRDDRRGDWNDDERIRLEEDVNQTFRGENILPLRRILDIDGQYRGYDIKRVVVFGSSAAGHGQATLLINGRQEGQTETLDIFGTRAVFEVRPGTTIGEDLRTLQLQLRGNITIDRVVAVLVDRDQPGGGGFGIDQVERRIMTSFDQFRSLDVMRELSLDMRRGQTVRTIELDAEVLGGGRGPRYGQSLVRAELLINGRPTGQAQYIDRFSGKVRFDVRAMGPASRIEVQFDGPVYVTTLSADLVRGNGPGPIPGPRVLEARPMRRVFGDEDVSVASLIGTRAIGRMMRMEVEVENRGMRGQMRLCDRALGTLGCSNTERLQDGRGTVVLSLAGADINSSTLAIRGDLMITSIRVFLDR